MKKFECINLLNLTDAELLEISKKNLLSLNIQEMKVIQNYYKSLDRNPTDLELETIAQTWSEHCKHKTLMGVIKFTCLDDKNNKLSEEIIDNLLKSTIVAATTKLNKSWCLSVFKDNAGVIEFDEKNGVAFKVETHNHPSALEPYGGAGTGIGGVIRDILGVGLGAKPICNTDVFCFGNPDATWNNLPKGVLHPKQIIKGVVEGVRDYGNRMGIPTINGAVLFDEGFTYNPLVYCGTVGIIPKDCVEKDVKPGDYIVAVGGRTGRDGIHGATFSSLALDENTESSAVQIGNPIVEKKILDTLLQARDKKLYRGITDCGAGGFSSAIGELGENTGVELHLDKAPLKYDGLKPWEIWVSEAQERMVLAVNPKNIDEIIKIFEDEDVEATVLGKFTDTKKLVLFYSGEKVCELEMDFLHNGVPRYTREAEWKNYEKKDFDWNKFENLNLNETLQKILSHPNISSKEWIIRQYDHEVQGGTIIKPLQGENSGPGDSSVIKPFFDSFKGVAVGCGINFEYGKFDPYLMTLSNIEEAIRNVLCSGGVIEKMALLDNFCWGDTNDKKELGGVVLAAKACYDASIFYEIPFVSGKDSLNNTYLDKSGNKNSIPGTLLISSIAVLKDIRKCLTTDFKKSGNLLYLVGNTKAEMGGSIFAILNNLDTNLDTNIVPSLDLKISKDTINLLNRMIDEELLVSLHDLSDGGLGSALAEMAIGNMLGAEVDITNIPVVCEKELPSFVKLFSESNSRFLIELNPENKIKLEEELAKFNIPFSMIGKVVANQNLVIKNKEKIIVNQDLENLAKSFKKFCF